MQTYNYNLLIFKVIHTVNVTVLFSTTCNINIRTHLKLVARIYIGVAA